MARSRAGSRLSFRRSSSGSAPRIEAAETPQEKHRFYVKGKADPSKAINEAEPAAVATSEVTLGKPLRDLEHRDQDGNVIVDPDRSNPTRPRLERPLDTIRSFEAAIDGSYYRRQSFRAETPNPLGPQSRRSGFFPGQPPPQRRGYSESGGFYMDRHANNRQDNYHDHGNPSSAAQYGGGQRRFGPRTNSDPALFGHNQHAQNANQYNMYSSHGHQQSYDTVGTASNGSHMTEPWGNSTDPSSENSSVDRYQPHHNKPEPSETYGFNGFGGGPNMNGPMLNEYPHGAQDFAQYGAGAGAGAGAPPSYGGNPSYHQSAQGPPPPPVPRHGPPAPPPKDASARRGPPNEAYKNKRLPPQAFRSPQAAPQANEKRRSWLKKTFSRA